MKPTWTKRYGGPGHPVDPNSKKHIDFDGVYQCVLKGPTPRATLHSESWRIPIVGDRAHYDRMVKALVRYAKYLQWKEK